MDLTQTRRRLFNDLIGIRTKRGISQAQVAEAIGINRSGISRFESDIEGSNPTMDIVLRYAHAVGAAIDIHVETVEDHQARRSARSTLGEYAWRIPARTLRKPGFVPADTLDDEPMTIRLDNAPDTLVTDER
ncbi:helix-turn-helix transcriptional regulator [Nocardia carnea]|uniref:helix-turn-helix transcriptional regulator n=1 Tax=Nocardia carnea TaxID=37328 RepID=UPI00245389A8|nr:helix-turn-helix transcriptional regulator [Nocardia carnea]